MRGHIDALFWICIVGTVLIIAMGAYLIWVICQGVKQVRESIQQQEEQKGDQRG